MTITYRPSRIGKILPHSPEALKIYASVNTVDNMGVPVSIPGLSKREGLLANIHEETLIRENNYPGFTHVITTNGVEQDRGKVISLEGYRRSRER